MSENIEKNQGKDPEVKTFTQEEADAIIGKRLAKALTCAAVNAATAERRF